MIKELSEMLITFKDQLIELIPQIILSSLVLGIGYLIARLIKYLITKLVAYINTIINQRYDNVDLNQSGAFISVSFFWIVMLSTFILIANILNLTFISDGFEAILRYSPNILAAILTVFIGLFLGKFIAKSIGGLSTRSGFSNAPTLGKIAQYLVIITSCIIAVDQIGFEVSLIVTMLNIVLAALLFGASIAFALGARSSVSNILATYYVRKQYKIGDHIKIGEIEGKIIRIDGTVVILESAEGDYTIPSKDFSENKSLLIKNK